MLPLRSWLCNGTIELQFVSQPYIAKEIIYNLLLPPGEKHLAVKVALKGELPGKVECSIIPGILPRPQPRRGRACGCFPDLPPRDQTEPAGLIDYN